MKVPKLPRPPGKAGCLIAISDCNSLELFVYSFRLIYRIVGNEIRVLTVIHGSRGLVPEMLGEAEQ